MAQLSLKNIIVDPSIQIRHGYSEEAVNRYMAILNKLPGVTVFDTPEGWLLADGFQRTEAARRLGWKAINGGLRKGTRKDAEAFAAMANVQHGLPLTPTEREDAVRRLVRLNPDAPYARIAEQLAVSPGYVGSVVAVDTMRQRLGPIAEELGPGMLRELSKLPADEQIPLAEAAVKRRWTGNMTALAVRNLREKQLPESFKEQLRIGLADPVYVGADGSYAQPIEVVVREIQRQTDNDPLLALEQALAAMARLRTFSWNQIMASADRVRRERIRSEMPAYIAFLQEGLQPRLQILEGKAR